VTDGRKFFAKDYRCTLPAGVGTDLMDRLVDDGATVFVTLGAPDTAVVNAGYYEGQVPARATALVDNARARTRLTELSDRLIR
jgi:hypothetical protein